MNHSRILIVGAGLAGLALARALRHAGLAPQVVEREVGRGVAGTGIYLPPHRSDPPKKASPQALSCRSAQAVGRSTSAGYACSST
jgi:2-polyprenyl-6-methoxyphenol hydroxylase-like FAD-dependent oxidoreductase